MEIPVVSGPGAVFLEGKSTVEPTLLMKKTQFPPIIEYEPQYPPGYYSPPLPPPPIVITQTPYMHSQYEPRSPSFIRTSDISQKVLVQTSSLNRVSFLKDFFFVFFGMILTGIPLAVITTFYLQNGNTCGTTASTATTTMVSTTTTANWTLPSQCTTYTTINDASRNILAGSGSLCDNTLTTGWYRFIGNGTKLATSHVNRDACTTWYGGHFNGTMPSTPGTTTYGTYCNNRDGALCASTGSGHAIGATHCDTYFVYYLQRITSCNSRYCTTN